MIDLEVRDLRLVKMIAETGALTRAAGRLNITQSALSKQLLDLEDRVGASLFLRQAKGMTPTEVGRELIKIADDLLSRLLQAELKLSRRVAGQTGELRLGVHCISCYSWLPEALALFQERYPEASLSVTNTDNYAEDIAQGRIEIAITHLHPGDIGDSVAYEDLFASSIVVIMAINHPLASKHQLELADFAAYDYYSLLAKTEAPLYNYFLKPAGIEPKNFIVLTQTQALMGMVASTQGLAILPAFVVNDMVAGGKLAQATVAGVPLQASLVVARSKQQPLSPYAMAFIETAQGLAREPD